MSTDYSSRLSIPLAGSPDVSFFTKSGSRLATGYERVVIGDRGPYVEFKLEQLNADELCESPVGHYYYAELRSVVDDVKVYVQIYRVSYADYVPGLCYVSPFELYDERGNVLITPVRG